MTTVILRTLRFVRIYSVLPVCTYKYMFFKKTFARFSLAPVGCCSRSRLRGTQGGPPVRHGASLGPGRTRCACSGRSKSRNLACSHGVAFRGARAEQDNGKPTATAVKRSSTVTTVASNFPRSYSYGPYYACVDHCLTCVVMMYACMLCVCSVYVCRGVRLGTGLSMTHASTRLLRVGKNTYSSTCTTVNIFSCSCIYLNGAYISVH